MKLRVMIAISALSGLAACQLDEPAYDQRTYSADCSNPPAELATAKDGIGHLAILLHIEVDQVGEITWAGVPVSIGNLRSKMDQAYKLVPQPQLILIPSAAAPCGTLEMVRKTLVDSAICREGRLSCSEGRNPEKWPIVGGP